MELEEAVAREAIRRTLARYTLSGDRGRLDELAACFTEAGVLEIEGEWTARGRSEIARQTGSALPSEARPRKAPLVRHNLTTQGIELASANEARAWTYFTVVTEAGPDHQGRYVDRLQRIGDEWLIAHRRVVVEWYARDSVYPEHARRWRARRGA